MSPPEAAPPLAVQVLSALRRQGWVLALTVLVGIAGALALRTLLPVQYSTTGLVRIAAIYPSGLVLQPATVAVEASTPDFAARVRERAGVSRGSISALAWFKSDHVEVRAVAPTATESERLADAATALLVHEQNALLEDVRARATSEMTAACAQIAVAPILTRLATRIYPLQPARPVVPRASVFLAMGLGVGVLVGVAWIYVRAVRREGL